MQAATSCPRRLVGFLSAVVLLLGAAGAQAESLAFRVRLDAGVGEGAFDGRLFVFLSERPGGEPRFGPDWFRPEPFFAVDVADFRPGQVRVVDETADAFPDQLSKLKPGTYRVQAVLHHAFDSPHPGRGVGNFYSDVKQLPLDPSSSATLDLVLKHVVPAPRPPESEQVKEIAVRSELLSQFHGREVVEPALVVLPASYRQQPERRYPVVYVVPAFGQSHRSGVGAFVWGTAEPGGGEVECLRVTLSGRCRWGHHVLANSATNGPRGDAVVEEIVPYVDANFRTLAAPTARFLAGHSSGGWAVLWLQIRYPDTFAAAFSSAPDPVDFRHFQGVDIYATPPSNVYRDEQGRRRPIARRDDAPVLWYDEFTRMDDVLGCGGQLRSFEAVFSPLGPDGRPRRLWDRPSGRIDPEVARAWRQYDVRAQLEENWDVLGPKLAGKLHITVGGRDTFYLDDAVRRLAESLKRLGSDAQIEIVPGGSHSSILTADYARQNRRRMSELFRKHHAPHGP